MTTYNAAAVSDTAIAHKNGISLQQGRALRDNPIAISEGASGAPYNLRDWHPYDSAAVGDGNDGTIYDFSVDGSVTTITSPTFDSDWSYGFVFDELTGSGGGGTGLRIEALRAVGSTWVGGGAVITTSSGGVSGGPLGVLRPYVASRYVDLAVMGGLWGVSGGTNTSEPFGSELAPIYTTTTSAFSAVRFSLTAGTFTAGTVKMLRRKDYW